MRIILSILAFVCLSNPSFTPSQHLPANHESKAAQHYDLRIVVKDGLVSMDVKNAEIVHVLTEIARKASIDLTFDKRVSGKISIKMVNETIESALKKLTENKAMVFEYLPDKNAYRVISVGAYSGQKGDMVQQRADGDEERKKKAPSDADPGVAGKSPVPSSEELYDGKGRLLYKPREMLVKFKEDVPETQIAVLHSSLGSTVLKEIKRIRLQRIKLREGLSEQEAIELYSASGIVELVERHALRYPNIIPNDPYFGEQWGLTKMKAPEAWDVTQGIPEIAIAVIDSGVDYSHPDLSENMWVNTAEKNGIMGVDDDGNGYKDDLYGWDFAGTDEYDSGDEDADPIDVDGHGTHVAGIIAAKGNDGVGIAGVIWDGKIIALKVQADNSDYMESWAVIEAIYYAIDNSAQVINCSFGGKAYQQSEYQALGDLRDAGILAVCAAGNDGTDAIPNYPASYDLDNIISVAASDQDDSLAYFSNYGSSSVDIMAPGVDIKSSIPPSATTEASVEVQLDAGTTKYPALGMKYAGTTDEDGIAGQLYDCGLGYLGEFPAGVSENIALIRRGGITFSEKTTNAQSAGAAGVIIYNNVVDDLDQNGGTLGSPGNWVPVVSISKQDGEALKTSGLRNVSLVNRPLMYEIYEGTSMATAFVTGIAGLILSKNPSFDYAAVKSAIVNSVDKIPSVADKILSGGRVNALSALCGIPGDLSCDYAVGLEDAILALQVISGLSPQICSQCVSAGIDLNGDGRVGLEEAIYVMQKLGDVVR